MDTAGQEAKAEAATAPSEALCAEKWIALRSTYNGNLGALLTSWKNEAKQCAGSGVYEYYLAATLAKLGEHDQAIEVLEAAIERKLPFHDESRVSLLTLRFAKAMLEQPADLGAAAKASEDLEQIVSARPDLMLARQEFAAQQLGLRDFRRAKLLAHEAMGLDDSSWLNRRTFVVASAELSECGDAKSEIRRALEINEELLADYQFMLAAASCYLSTGDVLTAEQVLLALRSRKPEVESEEAFRVLASEVVTKKANSAPRP